jgi:hypothetical protein
MPGGESAAFFTRWGPSLRWGDGHARRRAFREARPSKIKPLQIGAWHQFPISNRQEIQALGKWCLAPISDLTDFRFHRFPISPLEGQVFAVARSTR